MVSSKGAGLFKWCMFADSMRKPEMNVSTRPGKQLNCLSPCSHAQAANRQLSGLAGASRARELTGAASQGQNTVIWCCSFIVVPYPWRAHVGCSSGPTPGLHDPSSTVFKKLLIHNTSIRTVGSKLCLAINRAM